MPGLSQLKQFNKDIQSLGDELTIRASRGEKPVRVPIPRSVEDRDDTEDFVLGMPEVAAPVENTAVDDDLSDITGISTGGNSKSSGEEDQSASFEAPDMSSLLNPVMPDFGGDDGMPDLSMFMDAPAQEEEQQIVEEEPEEIAIADMGLDALLSGAGFDGSEGADLDDGQRARNNDDYYYDDDFDTPSATTEPSEALEEVEPIAEIPEEKPYVREPGAPLDLDALGFGAAPEPVKAEPVVDSLPEDPFSVVEPLPEEEVLPVEEDFSAEEPLPFEDSLPVEEPVQESMDDFGADIPVFNMEDISLPEDMGAELAPTVDFGDETETSDELGFDLSPADEILSDNTNPFTLPTDTDLNAPAEELELPETPSFEENDFSAGADNFDISSLDLGDLNFDSAESTETAEVTDSAESTSTEDLFGSDGSLNLDGLGDLDLGESSDFETSDTNFSLDDLGDINFGDSSFEDTSTDTASFDNTSFDETSFAEAPSEETSFDAADFGDLSSSDTSFDDSSLSDASFGEASFDDTTFEDTSFDEAGLGDTAFGDTSFEDSSFGETGFEEKPAEEASFAETPGLDDFGADSFEATESSGFADSFDMPESGSTDFSSLSIDESSEIPEYSDDNAGIFGEDDGASFDDFSQDGPVEIFDTSEMEGEIDFGIKDTDSQLNDDSDFGDGEFEISGFTDVEVADPNKVTKKNQNLDEPDFSGALPGKELPPNTLSDEQYKKFLKNLSEYPLNVRLAFENFIVQDEFTDDAEFEIIEKILNKAPARQVAAMLEKMLDISIPVPRDFEHRTAAEYEAYKKSLAYQLKNKIIPMAIMGLILLLVGWGLFNFGKYCIYIPARATHFYKQGYALLEADEYPQSEIYFDKAAGYKMKKKWFFKYARGYRERKQYQRAAKMYQKILIYFNHDKEAGLEFSDMALNDLADYAGAEEIVRREVLDYHIQDKDGLLQLGDIFLEWGTEKDPSKLELAKEQYQTLIAKYKPNNLYNSRMMRYYIRTDNLGMVLSYKKMFEPKEKNLSGEDWTELSGYLLKKLYGPLAPSEEALRGKIEGLRKLLQRAVVTDPENPVALYNLGNYYIQTNEVAYVEGTMKMAIEKFNQASHLKNRDIYKYIDSYRLLGENYIKTDDYLQAQEAYSDGITLYTAEKESAGFVGNEDVGHLYADLADINYFASGDYDNAELNYQNGVDLGYDNSQIRYRLGYMQYIKKNYQAALGSFIKAGEDTTRERNLMLAMANTFSMREDDYAAEGYYSQLINSLNSEIIDRGGGVFPQADKAEYDLVTTYLYAANNYGVTLYRLAKRTGDSAKNAQAIVQFQQSERAWDSLTRNQKTMVRLEGSNLAEENIKYVTHPVSEFEPSIYVEIPKTLTNNESL